MSVEVCNIYIYIYMCVCVCIYIYIYIYKMDNVIYISVTKKRIKCLGQLPGTKAYFQSGPLTESCFLCSNRRTKQLQALFLIVRQGKWIAGDWHSLSSCVYSCDRVYILFCTISYLHLQIDIHRARPTDIDLLTSGQFIPSRSHINIRVRSTVTGNYTVIYFSYTKIL